MTNEKKIKLYTSLEQSKKLTEILPEESADHVHVIGHMHTDGPRYEIISPRSKVSAPDKYWPCWSLAALLDVLPEIQGNKPTIYLNDNYIFYPFLGHLHGKADNLVDACVEIILLLHERNLL